MIRRATEADLPWIVESGRQFHEMVDVGQFDPAHAASMISDCTIFTDGRGVICGEEIPTLTCPDPAVNHVMFWNGQGLSWELLAAHEAQSNLPSSLTVPFEHPRSGPLIMALMRKGYKPKELEMIKNEHR